MLLLLGCIAPPPSPASADRAAWSASAAFELPIGTAVHRDHLTVAARPGGDWMGSYEALDTASGEEAVLSVLHDDQGQPLEPAWVAPGVRLTHPQVAWAGQRWVICWDGGGERQIDAVTLNARGRRQHLPMVLSPIGPDFDRFSYCDLVSHPTGEVSALWAARSLAPGSPAMAQLWHGTLGGVGGVQAAWYAHGPVALARRDDDLLVAAWTSPLVAGQPDRVQVALLDTAGTFVVGPVAVSDPAAPGNPGRPDVVVGPGGEVALTWGWDDPLLPGPMLRLLHPDLRSQGPAEALERGGGRAVALTAAGDHAAITWIRAPVAGRLQVHLRVIDFWGGPAVNDVVLAAAPWDPTVRALSVVDLVVDGPGLRGVVGWQQQGRRGVRTLMARSVYIEP